MLKSSRTTSRSILARLVVAPLFLLGCTSAEPGVFKLVSCPLDDGYYIGIRQLDPSALEMLIKAAKAHCKKKNKCLLAVTDEEIVCRDDYSTMEHYDLR